MRLFVALDLNSRVEANLTELVRRLDPIAPVRWVHPRNMHMTLKYIGEWEPERLPRVTKALGRVRVSSRMKLSLAGLGFFPSIRNPRVFWVAVENTQPLRQLASSVDASLSRLGVPPEVRPLVPHVTLGRLAGPRDVTELHEAIEELPSRDFGHIEPDSFTLYSSELTPEGIYRKIDEFPFLMRVPGGRLRMVRSS